MIELFAAGVWELLQPQVLIVLFLACIVGLVIGALPGLNATMAVAIILPLTFSFNAHLGMATLVAVYIGGICGGLVSAILLRIPGTPSSVATTFDGYPLAQQGQAVKALGTAMLASYAGGMFSLLVLVMFAPMVARLAINFGPAEYFALSVMALTMVAALAGKSLVKGAITALLGMAFSMVGMAPIDGTPRFTFGEINLWAGIGLVPFMIGLFAISQVLRELFRETPRPKVDMTIKGVGVTLKEIRRNLVNVFRSSGIGVGIGVLPGIGGAASNMIAYATARQSSKNPDSFGKGNVDGVWASESAGNASIGGALLPLITLGIPGDGVTAIIIGGFMIHGL
ncbi:tripartite tricarboxylate transporter permease, partial [Marinimicrobium sp. UBA4209]